MPHDGKIKTITNFVLAVETIKKDAKQDALTMLAAIPVEILDDPVELEDFMFEMLDAVVSKHVLTPKRKIRPDAAKAIHAYVRGMQ